MGFTKIDRIKFLQSCNAAKGIMPTVVIERQANLFEEHIDINERSGARWQKLEFVIKYPPLDDNPDGNPIPKQSARFTAKRHLKDDERGNKKGDVIVYTNQRTGKRDVIITSYPEARVVNTTNMIREQINMQIKNKYPNFTKFRDAIFITRLEYIFKHPANAPQYMINDIKNKTKIYFKTTKPDLIDNLKKIVFDSMQDIVFDNDAQVVSENGVFKRFGIVPGVIIEMEGEI